MAQRIGPVVTIGGRIGCTAYTKGIEDKKKCARHA
jgi:hypothetical protein